MKVHAATISMARPISFAPVMVASPAVASPDADLGKVAGP
jgi:hypothetical protein